MPDSEWLNEEPDVGKLLVRFCEGLGSNRGMAEILWHHWETRWQTENTNIGLKHRESPVYSTNIESRLECFGVWRHMIPCWHIPSDRPTMLDSEHNLTLWTNYRRCNSGLTL